MCVPHTLHPHPTKPLQRTTPTGLAVLLLYERLLVSSLAFYLLFTAKVSRDELAAPGTDLSCRTAELEPEEEKGREEAKKEESDPHIHGLLQDPRTLQPRRV